MAATNSCASNEDAARALITQGYKDPKVLEKHRFFVTYQGCGEDDYFAFDCTAVNANGKRVNLVVCMGLLTKAATVRSR